MGLGLAWGGDFDYAGDLWEIAVTPKERAEKIVGAQPGQWLVTQALLFEIERAIEAAVAEEREACAKVADQAAQEHLADLEYAGGEESRRGAGEAQYIAEKIRERSNAKT